MLIRKNRLLVACLLEGLVSPPYAVDYHFTMPKVTLMPPDNVESP